MIYECLLCDRIPQRLTPLQHCQALGLIAKSNSFFLWRLELLETESLQTDFVHLHATPPLNQWLGEGCWI